MKKVFDRIFAPEFDNCIGFLKSGNVGIDLLSRQKLVALYALMKEIKVQGEDELRSIWVEILRGGIRKFGSYGQYKREEMVSSREEYRQMWLDYYPRKTKWYQFSTTKYRDDHYFYINSRLIFTLNGNSVPRESHMESDEEVHAFLDGLLDHVTREIKNLRKDPSGWNAYLQEHLSYDLRFGKIQRASLWQIYGEEAIRFDRQLGKRRIARLKKYISTCNTPGFDLHLPQMTADRYFSLCETAYEANGYFKGDRKKLTAREKYTAMADGRDGGLRETGGNTEQAFRDWYHGEKWRGGHPWEICRGGNSTHISLSVHPEGERWKLTLAGSSAARVVETVKIAVALYDLGIPFELIQKEEILRMVTGEDYVGIVPEYVFPRYCHGFFPKEDRIIDFMNLDREDAEKIIPAASWYPLDRVETEYGENYHSKSGNRQ
jgi:hypothetical protein